MVAYLVQILDKPRRIIALKVWHTVLIVFLIKHVADLIVKLR